MLSGPLAGMFCVMQTVLFICTGNYYRSRYAEVRFNVIASRRRLDWRADSAGLRVDFAQKQNVGPMSADAVRALRRRGIDPTPHLRMPRPLTRTGLLQADRVVAMLRDEHYLMLAAQCPGWEQVVSYWDIQDRPPSDEYDPLAVIDAELEPLIDGLNRAPRLFAASAVPSA